MTTNFCSNCGQQLQAGARFCAGCGTTVGAPTRQPTAMQGLAQAGLEVQAFNGALIVGRLVGIAIAWALLWFAIGPAIGDQNPLAVIVAFFVLSFGGLLAGQWVTLQLLRR